MKKGIMITGLVSVALGLMLRAFNPQESGETESIWEKVPDEEIHTVIQKEEQAENIPEPEPVQEYETGTLEEDAQAAGALTDKEKLWIKKLAMAEAESEGEDGQWLVMSVVMNRVKDPDYPGSVMDVITQYRTKNGKPIYQFSSVGDGRIDVAEPSPDSEAALERILKGDIAPSLIAFEKSDSDVLDQWFEYAFTYRNHKFYVKKQKRE